MVEVLDAGWEGHGAGRKVAVEERSPEATLRIGCCQTTNKRDKQTKSMSTCPIGIGTLLD